MNITKTLVLRPPEPLSKRQKPWREFLKEIFAFGAIITVLSGVLYVSSETIPRNSWKGANPHIMLRQQSSLDESLRVVH